MTDNYITFRLYKPTYKENFITEKRIMYTE